MREILADQSLVGACGLYCGARDCYLSGRCPGCHDTKGSSCPVRSCCSERGYRSCADCAEYSDVDDCKKYNSWMCPSAGRLVGRTNREACIALIRKQGYSAFVAYVAATKRQSTGESDIVGILRRLGNLEDTGRQLIVYRALAGTAVTVHGRGDFEAQARQSVETLLREFATPFNAWIVDAKRRFPDDAAIGRLQTLEAKLPSGPMSAAGIADTERALLVAADERLALAWEAIVSVAAAAGIFVQQGEKVFPDTGTKCCFCQKGTYDRRVSLVVRRLRLAADQSGGESSLREFVAVLPMCIGCKRVQKRTKLYETLGFLIGGPAGWGAAGASLAYLTGGYGGKIDGWELIVLIVVGVLFGLVGGIACGLTGSALGKRRERLLGIRDTSPKYSLVQAGWSVDE